MRKKIIGIILLVLIIFGGYKLFANVSANNVNSKSIHFSYDDITEYKGDNPYVYVNDNKPYFTGSEIKDECYLKYGPLDSLKRGTSAIACINYDSMPAEDDKKGDSDSWNVPSLRISCNISIEIEKRNPNFTAYITGLLTAFFLFFTAINNHAHGISIIIFSIESTTTLPLSSINCQPPITFDNGFAHNFLLSSVRNRIITVRKNQKNNSRKCASFLNFPSHADIIGLKPFPAPSGS